MEIQSVQTSNGIWEVLKRGDEICIVDPDGRAVHRSKTHTMTAVFLAVEMSARYVPSTNDNADIACQMQAQNFREGKE